MQPTRMVKQGAARTIILLSGLVTGIAFAAPASYAAQTPPAAGLEVLETTVDPSVVWSGGTIEVRAVVVVRGQNAVHNLRLGLAVSGEGPSGRKWTPLETNLPEPIQVLMPSEAVSSRGTARLEGDGWLQIGVAGSASNLMLVPQLRRVRVVEPGTATREAATLLAFYGAIFAIVVVSARYLFWSPTGRPTWDPKLAVVGSGVALTLGGPTGVWALFWWLIRELGYGLAPMWAMAWLPLGGAALFAAGWLVVGAGLRPRGSPQRGMIFATILYVVVGLGWAVAFNVSLGAPVAGLAHPGVLFLALIWPLQVAQVLGLFGLSMG